MSRVYQRSTRMDQLFATYISKPVKEDPRTNRSENTILGLPISVVREQVLQCGRTDFRNGYGPLTPNEVVQLYCYLNMRRHFFECLSLFDDHRLALRRLWLQDRNVVLVDIGCGPATACLAFTEAFPEKPFNYLGIDIAPAMIDKAQDLYRNARRAGILPSQGRGKFLERWDELKAHEFRPSSSILIVCSYLFASLTLVDSDVRCLADTITSVRQNHKNVPIYFLYTNGIRGISNHKYWQFKNLLMDVSTTVPRSRTIRYRRNRNSLDIASELFMSDFFELKE